MTQPVDPSQPQNPTPPGEPDPTQPHQVAPTPPGQPDPQPAPGNVQGAPPDDAHYDPRTDPQHPEFDPNYDPNAEREQQSGEGELYDGGDIPRTGESEPQQQDESQTTE